MNITMNNTTKTSKFKLAAYGLGIGGCGAMLAGSADATPVDVTFDFGTVLDASDGSSTSTTNQVHTASDGDLGKITWAGFVNAGNGKTNIRLGSYGNPNGFYFDGRFSTSGKPEYEPNTVSSTWGDGTNLSGNGTANSQSLGLSANGNTAFWSGNYTPSLTFESDVTGVVGFKTFDQKWGYVEFDWDATAKTLTILSAKAETVAGTPITFNIPEPGSLALLSLGAAGLLVRRKRNAA